MDEITIHNKEEMDNVPDDFKGRIIIIDGEDIIIRGNKRVELYGHSSVKLYDSSSAVLNDSSSACAHDLASFKIFDWAHVYYVYNSFKGIRLFKRGDLP